MDLLQSYLHYQAAAQRSLFTPRGWKAPHGTGPSTHYSKKKQGAVEKRAGKRSGTQREKSEKPKAFVGVLPCKEKH